MADLLHDCPGGCGVRVVRNMLSCRDCWYRLPGTLRARLTSAYPLRYRHPEVHREALLACLEWYRTNPPIREVPDGVRP